MPLYRISGMTVLSEIVLPGAWPLESGEPDVVMRQGCVTAGLVDPLATTRSWDADADHFLLRAGIARFLLSYGNTVVFEPEDGVPVADCAVYLQGTVIGILLNQRGGVVLHASAVAIEGRAVLFCGISGAGKSTLAAALSLRGHAMISDDVSLVTFDARGRPAVRADARQLKLTDTAIDALALLGQRGAPVRGKGDKTYVRPPSSWGGADLPIGAVYMLRSRSPCGDVITILNPIAALRRIQRNAYRPGMVRGTGLTARYFAASARIVQHAGVFVIDRERELSRLPETAALIERHVRRPRQDGEISSVGDPLP